MFADTHVRCRLDYTRKLEHYFNHHSWNDTLMKTLDNRSYQERITFCVVTLFWNSKMATALKIDNSLSSLYLSLWVYIQSVISIQYYSIVSLGYYGE